MRPNSGQSDLLATIERIKSANSQKSDSAKSQSPIVNIFDQKTQQSHITQPAFKKQTQQPPLTIGQRVQGTNRRILSTNENSSHLVEIEAEATLYFYGQKSLDELDNQLGNNVTSSVTTISFQYIDFDYISKYFIKIRNKFSNLSVSI